MRPQHTLFCPCCTDPSQRGFTRRQFLTAAAALAAAPGFANAQTVPSIRYDSVADPVRLPADIYFGECSGVAVNSHGHIFVLSRGNSTGPAYGAAAAQLLEFAPNGKFVREIGHNLYAWSFAHTARSTGTTISG
jgi:hypothetical protein